VAIARKFGDLISRVKYFRLPKSRRNRLRTETNLITVLKFDDACFNGGEANAVLAGKWNDKKEEELRKNRAAYN